MRRRWNKRRLKAERSLTREQTARSLAISLHLSLAQALGLLARFGAPDAGVYAVARRPSAGTARYLRR